MNEDLGGWILLLYRGLNILSVLLLELKIWKGYQGLAYLVSTGMHKNPNPRKKEFLILVPSQPIYRKCLVSQIRNMETQK